MLNIIFCIPGNNFSNIFLNCWTNLVFYCLNNNINPILANAYDSNVYFVRSKILGGSTLNGTNQKPFNDTIKYDYIMFIDSDIVFKPEDFAKLLNMNVNIASGCYLMDGGTEYCIVENLNNTYFLDNGHYEFISLDGLRCKTDNFLVDYCGMGFMLIKYNVIEKLTYPWFSPKTIQFNDNITEFASEDVSFCLSLKDKGFSISVNPSVKVGHEKKMIYLDNQPV